MAEPRPALERAADALAIKPSEASLAALGPVPAEAVVVDWEGHRHFPSSAVIAGLADAVDLRVTVSVRADGFDPLGDDHGYDRLPAGVDLVLVAGHGSYLRPAERIRAVAPRLRRAVDRFDGAWVGTEGIEALARATGATQFELLGPDVEERIGHLRRTGFDGSIAVYAPSVLSTDPDEVIGAVGDYVARRPPVADRLRGDRPDAEVLLEAAEDWALVGPPTTVRDRAGELRAVGADHVVCYPAGGIDQWRPD